MNEAEHFHAMGERIVRIDQSEFAGAAVIVPPGAGEPIAFLIADPAPDLVQFWSSVKTRVEIAHAEAMEVARTQNAAGGAWGGR